MSGQVYSTKKMAADAWPDGCSLLSSGVLVGVATLAVPFWPRLKVVAISAQAGKLCLAYSTVNVVEMKCADIRESTRLASITAPARGEQRILTVGSSEMAVGACSEPACQHNLGWFKKPLDRFESLRWQIGGASGLVKVSQQRTEKAANCFRCRRNSLFHE